MGRRVISPELGCVKAEDMPGASGTRPTILGPGSGSRSPGQCWKFGSPTGGFLHPPGDASKEEASGPPHLKQQAIL